MSPRIVLARRVSTSSAGCTMATTRFAGRRQRHHLGWPSRQHPARTPPPAKARRCRRGRPRETLSLPDHGALQQRRPVQAAAQQHVGRHGPGPPRLAALPPSPEASGIPLCTSIATPASDPVRSSYSLHGQRGGIALGVRRNPPPRPRSPTTPRSRSPQPPARPTSSARALQRHAEDVEPAPQVGHGTPARRPGLRAEDRPDAACQRPGSDRPDAACQRPGSGPSRPDTPAPPRARPLPLPAPTSRRRPRRFRNGIATIPGRVAQSARSTSSSPSVSFLGSRTSRKLPKTRSQNEKNRSNSSNRSRAGSRSGAPSASRGSRSANAASGRPAGARPRCHDGRGSPAAARAS